MHQAGRSLPGAITVLSDKTQPPAARHIRVSVMTGIPCSFSSLIHWRSSGVLLGEIASPWIPCETSSSMLSSSSSSSRPRSRRITTSQPDVRNSSAARRVPSCTICMVGVSIGLQDDTNPHALLGPYQRLTDDVRLVAQFVAIFRMRAATSGLTRPRLCSARSTVPRDTPASSAIFCAVTAIIAPPCICCTCIHISDKRQQLNSSKKRRCADSHWETFRPFFEGAVKIIPVVYPHHTGDGSCAVLGCLQQILCFSDTAMIQILDRGELIQRFEYVDDMAGGQMELFRKTGQRDILLKCVFRYARIRLDGEDGCSGDRERPGSAANWSSKASSSLSRATGSVADCCMICKRDRMVGLDRMEYSRQSCELSGTEAPVKNSMVIRRVEFSGRIAWHSPGGTAGYLLRKRYNCRR